MEPEENIFSDAAILVDEATVNGIHCKHYIVDMDTPTVHMEAWVADQGDLPPCSLGGYVSAANDMVTINQHHHFW